MGNLRFTPGALLVVTFAAGAAGAQTAPRPPATPAAPIISITARAPEYRGAEGRLASFITALQQDRRLKAARLLSSRVKPEERRALIEGRWLRPDPTRRGDFTQVLFLPDLQIRTRAIFRDTVRLTVTPRTARRKSDRRITGFLEVRMRKEGGRWQVEMHPD